MSQFISKIKKLPTNVSEKVIKHSREAQTLLMLLLMNPMYSRAAGTEDTMRAALDVFFNIFGYVGVFLLVAGLLHWYLLLDRKMVIGSRRQLLV